jgi:hypothetical protein
MILKTIRWKSNNFKKIISYILDKDWKTNKSSFAIYNNIKRPDKILQEFKNNDRYRKRRKNGVVLYHEVLSFHQKDSKKLTLIKLKEIAEKYISIRSPNALCFASPHFDTDNIHIHFCFSGTEYKSSKTLRMDNKFFKKIKLDIEAYQKKQFPELVNSIVYSTEKELDKRFDKDKYYQTKNRLNKANTKTDKDQLKDSIKIIFLKSTNFDDFIENLKLNKYEVYSYRNKPRGIIFNKRKYRFKLLGIDKKRFDQIEANKEKLNSITSQRRQKIGLRRNLTIT